MSHVIEGLEWVGGENDFALNLGQIRALQEKTNRGPEEIFHRLTVGAWFVDEVIETLRLGLVGAGMENNDARKKVMAMADQYGLSDLKSTAQAVLLAALVSPEGDRLGEHPGGIEPPLKNGSSANSTAPGQ